MTMNWPTPASGAGTEVGQPAQLQFAVTSMPWQDADGDRGHYTGQVDVSSVPNGIGTMEYDDGPVVEGAWRDGILEADSSEDGDTAGEKEVQRQRKRLSEPGNNLGVIPERQPVRGSLRGSAELLHSSHRDLSQDSHGDPCRYNAGASPGDSSGCLVERPRERAKRRSRREDDLVSKRMSRSISSERWSRNSVSDSIKEESADDLNRENSGFEDINRNSSGDADGAADPGRRGSGRDADYFTRGIPIDEVPVQEASSFRSLRGVDAEFARAAEGASRQVAERHERGVKRSSTTQDVTPSSSNEDEHNLQRGTRSARAGDNDAPVLDRCGAIKATEAQSERQRIRRRKWCLFFSAFAVFCLGAAAVCGYMIVRLKQDGQSALTQSIGAQTNNAPDETERPWDPDAPCAEVVIRVITDSYGNETSWELFYSEQGETSTGIVGANTGVMQTERKRLRQHSASDGGWGQTDRRRRASTAEPTLVLSRGPFPYLFETDPTYIEGVSGQYTSSICLPIGYYKFAIYDARGDGLCCAKGSGGYSLSFENGRVVKSSDGQFGSEEATEFVVAEEDIRAGARTESPSMSVMPTPAPSSAMPTGVPRVLPAGVQTLSTVTRDVLVAGSATSYGVLFDVVARNVSSLTIQGMDLLIEAEYPVTYEIWSKPGSWRDVAGTNYIGGFELVSNGTMNGTGLSELSIIPLDDFRDVTIEGGSKQAFYMTLKESSMMFQNYRRKFGQGRESGFDVTLVSSPEFDVMYGSAVMQYPLEDVDPFADFLDYKGFLGEFFYTVVEADPASVSSIGTTQPTTSGEPVVISTSENAVESLVSITESPPTEMATDTGNITKPESLTENENVTTVTSLDESENGPETSVVSLPRPLPAGSESTLTTNDAGNLTATPTALLGNASSPTFGVDVTETVAASSVSPMLETPTATLPTVSSTSSPLAGGAALEGGPIPSDEESGPADNVENNVGDGEKDEGELTSTVATMPPPPLSEIPADAVNLALFGMADQSSTCFNAVADRAIDGDHRQYFGSQSVAHTCAEENPWWQVDLGQLYDIGHVIVKNRGDDCCLDRLDDSVVQVLNEDRKPSAVRPIINGLTEVHISFDPPVKGRYVVVQKTVFGDLSLAEVLVYSDVYDVPNGP